MAKASWAPKPPRKATVRRRGTPGRVDRGVRQAAPEVERGGEGGPPVARPEHVHAEGQGREHREILDGVGVRPHQAVGPGGLRAHVVVRAFWSAGQRPCSAMRLTM